MINVEEVPYAEVMREWFKRMGYAPMIFESNAPVRLPDTVRGLTKKERERVNTLSKERGYRRFHAFGRAK